MKKQARPWNRACFLPRMKSPPTRRPLDPCVGAGFCPSRLCRTSIPRVGRGALTPPSNHAPHFLSLCSGGVLPPLAVTRRPHLSLRASDRRHWRGNPPPLHRTPDPRRMLRHPNVRFFSSPRHKHLRRSVLGGLPVLGRRHSHGALHSPDSSTPAARRKNCTKEGSIGKNFCHTP